MNETEEGKKVERAGATKYLAIFRRRTDAEVEADAAATPPAALLFGPDSLAATRAAADRLKPRYAVNRAYPAVKPSDQKYASLDQSV